MEASESSTLAPCFLCEELTSSCCPSCLLASCPLHLPSHRPLASCLPFTVRQAQGVGRYMVATRDIQAMEVILTEEATVVGPNHDTEALCPGCLARVDGSLVCPQCKLPCCSLECAQKPQHSPECAMFSQMTPKVEVKIGERCNEYSCITVLRLLTVRDRDPVLWARLGMMMDHREERSREQDYWKMMQRNVVEYLRIKGGLAEVYTEEEIHWAIGVLRTNALTVEHPYMESQGTLGRALYPNMAILSHSCLANARFTVNADCSLVLRAKVDILEGQEITMQYISFLYDNSRRRRDIRRNWMFECSCARCSDPTELGTLLCAQLCQECGGNMLPADSTIDCGFYRCQDCRREIATEEADDVTRSLEEDMRETYGSETESYRFLLKKYSELLHPQHAQILTLKYHLSKSLKGRLTLEQTEERIQLQEDFMRVFQVVDPGYSAWRGKILGDICKMKLAVADYKVAKGVLSKEEFFRELETCVPQLMEVITSLEHEQPTSEEFKVAKEAKASLAQAKEVLEIMKLSDTNKLNTV